MKWKPTNKEELYEIIKEIVTNQKKDPDYKFGLKDIDVSLITDMSGLFSCDENAQNSEINKKIDWDDSRNDITLWNTSNVTDMVHLFSASNFNQPIGKWNVSNVTNMWGTFVDSHFNQDISNWDVSNVTDMADMFYNNINFDQDISNWDVSSVTNMCNMFFMDKYSSGELDPYFDTSFSCDISVWKLKLPDNVNLNYFNLIHEDYNGRGKLGSNNHAKMYGRINSKDDININSDTALKYFKKLIYSIKNSDDDYTKYKKLKELKRLKEAIDKYDIEIDYSSLDNSTKNII